MIADAAQHKHDKREVGACMEIMDHFNIYQMLVTALTLTLAGVIGFWCRDIPIRLWRFILRQSTTTLHITSAHNAFYCLMRFIEAHYQHKNFRNFKLTNGKWGCDDIAVIGIGYGGHFIKFEKLLLYVNLAKENAQGTSVDKETITITKLGRNSRKRESGDTQPVPRQVFRERAVRGCEIERKADLCRAAGSVAAEKEL